MQVLLSLCLFAVCCSFLLRGEVPSCRACAAMVASPSACQSPPRMKAARGKGKAKGKAKAVTKKVNKAGWKPATCVQGYEIVGGFLKKPVHLDVEMVANQPFAKLSKNEAWLCMAASGKARGLQPLARTDVIEKLSTMVAESAEGGDGPADSTSSRSREAPGKATGMRALGLDEEASPAPMNRRGRRSRKPTSRPKAQKKGPPSVLEVELPPELATDGKLQVRCLSGPPRNRIGGAPWLHVDDLGWLVDKLADQVINGGVSFVPSPSSLRKPFWSERDHSWICRAKAPGGKVLCKSMAVPFFEGEGHITPNTSMSSRRPLTASEWKHARGQKLAEIEQWQEAVEAGLVED